MDARDDVMMYGARCWVGGNGGGRARIVILDRVLAHGSPSHCSAQSAQMPNPRQMLAACAGVIYASGLASSRATRRRTHRRRMSDACLANTWLSTQVKGSSVYRLTSACAELFDCAAGSYCPAGSFTSGNDNKTRSACTKCVAGHSCDGTSSISTCGAGTYAATGSSSCTP